MGQERGLIRCSPPKEFLRWTTGEFRVTTLSPRRVSTTNFPLRSNARFLKLLLVNWRRRRRRKLRVLPPLIDSSEKLLNGVQGQRELVADDSYYARSRAIDAFDESLTKKDFPPLYFLFLFILQEEWRSNERQGERKQ